MLYDSDDALDSVGTTLLRVNPSNGSLTGCWERHNSR